MLALIKAIKGGLGMSLFDDLLAKPEALPVASEYTALNGILYMASGAMVLLWPGAVQTIFQDPGFVGREEALFRLIGALLVVVGWFYLFGGRSGARQIVAASVLDRLTLVPFVLGSLAVAGVFPHLLTTFAIVDPSLAIGAWLLLRRSE
jgi:hypothetical protein